METIQQQHMYIYYQNLQKMHTSSLAMQR